MENSQLFSTWFSEEIVFEGVAIAEFSDPIGVLQGPAKFSADHQGNSTIELHVEDFDPEHRFHFGLHGFLEWESLDANGHAISGGGGKSNECVKVTFTCPEGVLVAEKQIFFDASTTIGSRRGLVRFTLFQSEFKAPNSRPPHYWVLPLWNFTTQPVGKPPAELDRHPLRIRVTPPEEQDDPRNGKDRLAQWLRIAQNKIVAFEYKGQVAFIEPLKDYEQRCAELETTRYDCRVTAAMIANIGHEKKIF